MNPSLKEHKSPTLHHFPRPRLPLPHLKPIIFGPETCRDLAQSSSREWLITNGLGGYACSTIIGMNTRRHHGLLVAATHPPVGRMVLLSKVEETVVFVGGRYELSTNRYPSGVIHPEGYSYLEEFWLDPWPCFFYRIGEIILEKSVFFLPGENAVVISYTLHAASGPVKLQVRPLIAMRDAHSLNKGNPDFQPRIEQTQGLLTISPVEDNCPSLLFHHAAELVEQSSYWYKNFEYVQNNVSEGREDLWSPADFIYLLKPRESCALVASTGRRGTADPTFHQRRAENTQTVCAQTMTPPGTGHLTTRLSWTGENFVARGEAGERFLLSGFPNLSSWGRDALIALPGLSLSTKRYELARSLLETLASQVKDGLVPVRLSEKDGSPEYDSADTSLWFFWAVWHYWKMTQDVRFISKRLLGPMRQILESYLEGTNFGIRMDEDGLILLSDEKIPLTWMDAREPAQRQGAGAAVTVRNGKPIEMNALWFCALSVMAQLAEHLKLKRAAAYGRLARLVAQNFRERFIAPDGTICDCVHQVHLDFSVRPNMLIAASLPFSPFTKAQSLWVLNMTEKHLLTPVGIRTLSQEHPDFHGQYIGDLKACRQAAHQGTVWTWLLGPYVTTLLRVREWTPHLKTQLKRQLTPFVQMLEEGGLGSVPELFDGALPHSPRGEISSAWGTGELLRVIQLAKLGHL